MKYFKTRGERIFLALFIAWIFSFTFMIFMEIISKYDIAFFSFIALSPLVIYVMYKLIFQKQE